MSLTLQNAKEQGEILLEVQKRLEGTDLAFSRWVEEDTDIGLSTAYLWMDVSEWWKMFSHGSTGNRKRGILTR